MKTEQQEEPVEEENKSSLRDEHGKLPPNSLKRTVKKVIQFMSANNSMTKSFNIKTTYTNDAAIRYFRFLIINLPAGTEINHFFFFGFSRCYDRQVSRISEG